jgi:hypothetical protein
MVGYEKGMKKGDRSKEDEIYFDKSKKHHCSTD